MPLPNSIQAYQDCLDFMDKAMDDERGARMVFLTQDSAQRWRFRCNQARSLHRAQNKLVYEIGHKMYGCSEYDVLQFTIEEDSAGEWWIYARKMVLDTGRVELLSEIEDNDHEAST